MSRADSGGRALPTAATERAVRGCRPDVVDTLGEVRGTSPGWSRRPAGDGRRNGRRSNDRHDPRPIIDEPE